MSIGKLGEIGKYIIDYGDKYLKLITGFHGGL